jgi:hypothetical protein
MIRKPLFHGPGRLGSPKGRAGDGFTSGSPLGPCLRPHGRWGVALSAGLAVLSFALGLSTASVAFAQSTNRLARPDFSEFRLVTERNIFNPKRYAHSTTRPQEPAPRAVDSITLVGTMSYGKGPFAFFDSNSSDYRKVTKVSDTIAGYKVEAIAPAFVKLAEGTNELQLGVGMQLRREEKGTWQLASTESSVATGGTNGLSGAAMAAADPAEMGTNAPSGSADAGENDPVLKKLMERRNQENNR